MNLGNFTIKAAEAFQQAQQVAFNAKNPNIELNYPKPIVDLKQSRIRAIEAFKQI